MKPGLPRILLVMATAALLLACTTTPPRTSEVQQYSCDDGTGFTAEIEENVVSIHGPTGSVSLPRVRGADDTRYTNNLRTVILEDGSRLVRYRLGRRDWTECEQRDI